MPKKGTGPWFSVLGDDLTLMGKGHCWTPGSGLSCPEEAAGCLSSAGVPRFRPVLGEGSDHLNQQQPDHESPQAAGLLLQALPAQRSETLSGGLQPAHSCPACLSRGPRIPSSASCKRESDWLTWFMHGTPPSGLLQRLRDDPCPHPLGFLRPLSSAPASVLRASRRCRPRS